MMFDVEVTWHDMFCLVIKQDFALLIKQDSTLF